MEEEFQHQTDYSLKSWLILIVYLFIIAIPYIVGGLIFGWIIGHYILR